ncbi:XRN 5'-3' exonuclease N-terminus-domain-containing protein [Cantharellus anzutake]|uniref:XRN 5'-3' exonuclease N-terminus-domain-containing protein n=1 Tax=Cantharellus anzutake TaxID=1750568 RepID=UPI001904D06D|nr:XRN 5'-3' exonuclease N-terminus-domain-containing protein [Cantharellus anzutake]KAF8335021.1 XRN 5'-3' exonuclease N-terminus-domain-containing protein [Cantharellus anzutake]
MGVPALFRWLSKKYPKIITAVIEAEEAAINGSGSDHLDASLPNPNGFEVDNLYLDMNGIVHPCTHPEGKPPPDTEEDMMVEIFIYTERVVNMRSRRFRAVQEAREKEKEREAGIAMFEAMGRVVSDETKNKKSWDTNAITPGCLFRILNFQLH